MSAPSLVIRDRRQSGFFTIDNEIIDLFGDHYQGVGQFGLLVYMVLCRHARNETGECRVLQETIAQKGRISRTSVVRGLKELEDTGLVGVERNRKKVSVYTLLPVHKVAPKPVKNDVPIGHQIQIDVPIESHCENDVLLDTQNNTKPNKTETPSASRSHKPAADHRTESFRKVLLSTHKDKTGTYPGFDGRAGRALKEFLAKTPGLEEPGFRKWLENYWASDINPGDPPELYLPHLVRYSIHSLDRFNKPIGGNRGRQNRANERQQANAERIAREMGLDGREPVAAHSFRPDQRPGGRRDNTLEKLPRQLPPRSD